MGLPHRFGRSVVGIALSLIACSGVRPSHVEPYREVRRGPSKATVLDSVGDATVASYPPTGFAALTPSQRALAYHLVAAAWSADSLLTMQSSRFALPAQAAVRAILAKAERLEPRLRERVLACRRYLFLYHGLHDHWTSLKITLPISQSEFERAAQSTGVAVAPELLAAMFDPKVEPMLVDKNPGPGKDPIVESAASHYQGLTSKDFETYREKYELNGRLRKENGKIIEEVYRAGDARTPPGLAASEIRHIISHLRDASAIAPAREKRALERLVTYLETGDNERMREHDIEWLTEAFPIDYAFGFILTYDDVRQRKGSFLAFVSMPDPERNGPLQALAANAAYFEQKLPFAPEHRRDVFRPPAAAAVMALAATAGAGPFGFGGINLPDAQDLKEKYGSKNAIVLSVEDTNRAVMGTRRTTAFAPAEDRAEMDRCAPYLWYALAGFHEITGHGSGKVMPSLADDPAKPLAPHFGAMEEGRADLVADYLTGDPKTVEIGVLPDTGCARVYPAAKTTMLLTNHLQVPHGDVIEEDHQRAAFIELGFLRDKGVISVERRNGDVFFVVKDPDAWRRAVGELLAEYQRIKATGDGAALRALVEKYGLRLDPKLRDEVVARNAALNLPKRIATIPPTLIPIRDGAGRVIDAKAEQTASLDAYIDLIEHANHAQ
ncbi:dipeptidyl peptidase 3 [Pendulispora rubella]|uniref:Dipeptidyl peptidase 3 n=1 Tax=Pendulispora rubella TaxID=2741070 RepID=A0ABZ2KT74_9BACT